MSWPCRIAPKRSSTQSPPFRATVRKARLRRVRKRQATIVRDVEETTAMTSALLSVHTKSLSYGPEWPNGRPNIHPSQATQIHRRCRLTILDNSWNE